VSECDQEGGELVLVEKYYQEGATRSSERRIRLQVPEVGIAFKLDQEQQGKGGRKTKPPLFHFLEDDAKAWAKRCDFVIFWTSDGELHTDCIEFKTRNLAHETIVPQLKAGASWCRSLKHVIENYTGEVSRGKVRKFVFGTHDDPTTYLDRNRHLKADPSVRYYDYSDVDGARLPDLENHSPQEL
jgi:hypothetical protein